MYIARLETVDLKTVALVGGKAASLGEMIQAGIEVPPGFVLTTKAYDAYRGDKLDHVERELKRATAQLGASRVAVRSSAVGEDSEDASWAGQLETFLSVAPDHVLQAVKDCWQSATSQRVRSYAEGLGESADSLRVAVVVQQMVDSEVAGVGFSINPITGVETEVLIEAIHGLGELLVQGSVTPDTFIVAKSNGKVIDYQPNHQTQKLTRHTTDQTLLVEQVEGKRTLTDTQLKDICEQLKIIERHYGKPQDIEWAFSRGKLYIVQARPITT